MAARKVEERQVFLEGEKDEFVIFVDGQGLQQGEDILGNASLAALDDGGRKADFHAAFL